MLALQNQTVKYYVTNSLHIFFIVHEGDLQAKIQRRDSLARFLNQRPHRIELVQRNIIPLKSDEDRMEDRNMIGSKLNR